MKKNFALLFIVAASVFSLSAKNIVVSNAAEFNAAAEKVVAGDKIILENGVWNDARLTLAEGKGTAEAPIIVMAETMGQVILMGNSSIAISGDYVNVSGLVFTGETTAKGTVIETRTGRDTYANNCIISNCVVDSFNPVDKDMQTTYIGVWGKNNIIEDCYIGGKTNKGPTMVVFPNDEKSQQNYHHIRRNYFGARPSYGTNGGETLRIGSSGVSKSNSNTIVEENFFYKCDGEVEIISLKSCENQVINNTFYECQGGMTIRHGDRNIVTGNFFNGNDVQNTGGVRIINEGHTVANNLFYRLQGQNFYCTLSVMNGVPGTLINGYHKVRDVEVKNNTFVECGSYFELCVGKGDRDRDDKPENVNFTKNMIYAANVDASKLIKEHDTDHGVKFSDNVVFTDAGAAKDSAAKKVSFEMSKTGVNIPVAKGYGIDWADDKFIATASNCGPQWYLETLAAAATAAPQPKYIAIEAGADVIAEAIIGANSGDILVLGEGKHIITAPIKIHKDIKIVALKGAAPVIALEGTTNGFELYTGILTFEGVAVDGEGCTSLFTTGKEFSRNFHLVMNNCEIYNFTSPEGAVFKAGNNACGDYMALVNCNVHDCFRVLDLAAETELKGKYNSEYVVLSNSTFSNITEWVVNYIRLGVEDSTLGGNLLVENCEFNNVSVSSPESIILTDGIKTIAISGNKGLK